MKHPDSLIIVGAVLIFATFLTWIIPAGQFDREVVDNREILVPGSYRAVEQQPQGISVVLLAPVKGFIAASQIIAFVLIIGGAFAVVQKTSAIEAGLYNIIRICLDRPSYRKILIPMLMVLFSLAGATFGMSEEMLLFILITIPFAHALGYNTIVGVAIPFIATGAGFAGALTNPFTIGIAQGIAELPIFSGWQYRLVVWASLTTTAIIYVMRYANSEQARIDNDSLSPGSSSFAKEPATVVQEPLTSARAAILVVFLVAVILLIIGSTFWGWYINEITGLFIGVAIVTAIIGRLGANNAIAVFMEGAGRMMSAAMVIAFAKGILILTSDGKIIDTILYTMAQWIEGAHPVVSAQLMFFVQNVINFFVPSGSGQAALTMPIMSPLGDLLGVTRQTTVLIFQLGDGIGNMIIPTSGVTMGVLSAAKIPYVRWVRWVAPLIILFLMISMMLIIPPVLMHWQ